ncbi:MAG: serine/threonine-protein kinase [Polyangiaceae bacterium]
MTPGFFGAFSSAPRGGAAPAHLARSDPAGHPTRARFDARRRSPDPCLAASCSGGHTPTGILGQGAMGQVHRGACTRRWASRSGVKVMRQERRGDSVYRRRLAREARAASLLAHPNVVRVLDYGEDGDTPFIVMEFVEGRDLDGWLEELPSLPSLEQVGRICDQILSALAAAHERGIVHRDLKPENVMLCRLGSGVDAEWIAKVSDFGLAHVEDPRDSGPTLTQRDAVAGTPTYMSPEQCRSLAVGPSTDLYAFGCLLTTLLQGDPPFDGATPIDVISKQMFAEPPPLERPEGAEAVPPLLERLRLQLLAKKAHKRPVDAGEVRRRLAEALNPEANAERVPSRKGEIPGGGREQRSAVLGPTDAPTNSSALEVGELGVSLVVLPRGNAVDDALRLGLSAQGVRFLESGELYLLDAPDAATAADWLLAAPERQAVVCVPTIDTSGINALIVAGALEVLTQPLESGSLARRLRRAARRRGRG